MDKFRLHYPFDFMLLNQQQEHALLIQESTESITLSIQNKGAQDIRFHNISALPAGPSNFHFMLRFRPGTLVNTENIILQNEAWSMASAKEHGVDMLCFRKNIHEEGEAGLLSLSANLNLVMQNFKANETLGARDSNVELVCDNSSFADTLEVLRATRQVKWPIINHRGKKNLPLHVGFVGSNTILNNDEPNKLTLRISVPNPKTNQVVFKHHADDSIRSKIIISFDEGDAREEWVLAENKNTKVIEFSSGQPTLFDAVRLDQITPVEFKVYCLKKDIVLGRQDSSSDKKDLYVDLHFSNIKTTHPTGSTNCYIRFENIEGYWDTSFVCPIQKQPLAIRDKKVGIGKTPDAPFDIGPGKAGAVQAILARGANPKYQLVVQNGGSVDQANSELSRFGMLYAKLKNQWSAGIRFTRGENTKDVSMHFDTNGEERIKIAGDGHVEIKKDLKVEGRLQDKTGDVMPVGSIIAYGGKERPSGWLLCNGYWQELSSHLDLHKALGNPTTENKKWLDGVIRESFKVPDLRSRFIVGAGRGTGLSNYVLNAKEGEETHQLSVKEMPSHNHSGVTNNDGLHEHINQRTNRADNDDNDCPGQYITNKTATYGLSNEGYISSSGSRHQHAFSTWNKGSDEPHNNLPPYYALTYIIKY
jgi:microcystin-dependent protein